MGNQLHSHMNDHMHHMHDHMHNHDTSDSDSDDEDMYCHHYVDSDDYSESDSDDDQEEPLTYEAINIVNSLGVAKIRKLLKLNKMEIPPNSKKNNIAPLYLAFLDQFECPQDKLKADLDELEAQSKPKKLKNKRKNKFENPRSKRQKVSNASESKPTQPPALALELIFDLCSFGFSHKDRTNFMLVSKMWRTVSKKIFSSMLPFHWPPAYLQYYCHTTIQKTLNLNKRRVFRSSPSNTDESSFITENQKIDISTFSQPVQALCIRWKSAPLFLCIGRTCQSSDSLSAGIQHDDLAAVLFNQNTMIASITNTLFASHSFGVVPEFPKPTIVGRTALTCFYFANQVPVFHVDDLKDEDALEAIVCSTFKVKRPNGKIRYLSDFLHHAVHLFFAFQRRIPEDLSKAALYVQNILTNSETNALFGKKQIEEYIVMFDDQISTFLLRYDQIKDVLDSSFSSTPDPEESSNSRFTLSEVQDQLRALTQRHSMLAICFRSFKDIARNFASSIELPDEPSHHGSIMRDPLDALFHSLEEDIKGVLHEKKGIARILALYRERLVTTLNTLKMNCKSKYKKYLMKCTLTSDTNKKNQFEELLEEEHPSNNLDLSRVGVYNQIINSKYLDEFKFPFYNLPKEAHGCFTLLCRDLEKYVRSIRRALLDIDNYPAFIKNWIKKELQWRSFKLLEIGDAWNSLGLAAFMSSLILSGDCSWISDASNGFIIASGVDSASIQSLLKDILSDLCKQAEPHLRKDDTLRKWVLYLLMDLSLTTQESSQDPWVDSVYELVEGFEGSGKIPGICSWLRTPAVICGTDLLDLKEEKTVGQFSTEVQGHEDVSILSPEEIDLVIDPSHSSIHLLIYNKIDVYTLKLKDGTKIGHISEQTTSILQDLLEDKVIKVSARVMKSIFMYANVRKWICNIAVTLIPQNKDDFLSGDKLRSQKKREHLKMLENMLK